MTPKRVILHCSDTPASMDIGVKEIRDWHTLPPPKGNGWLDVGYHYVIRRDGTIEKGRPDNRQGSHCHGENHDSLGVCLVGGRGASAPKEPAEAGAKEEEALYAEAQLEALDKLYLQILVQHKIKWKSWSGHCEHTSQKICPNISMDEVRLRFSRL